MIYERIEKRRAVDVKHFHFFILKEIKLVGISANVPFPRMNGWGGPFSLLAGTCRGARGPRDKINIHSVHRNDRKAKKKENASPNLPENALDLVMMRSFGDTSAYDRGLIF